MVYRVTIEETVYEVAINGEPDSVILNGKPIKLDLLHVKDGQFYSVLLNNEKFEFRVKKSNGGLEIWHQDGQIQVDISDEKTALLRSLIGNSGAVTGLSKLKAPMPGMVIKIEVEIGQRVNKGDGLLIIEAMKMENEFKAHAPATVKEILVKPGQPVEKNQILMVFE